MSHSYKGLGLWGFALVAALRAQALTPFDDCERRLVTAREAKDAAECLYRAAPGHAAEAEERLERLALRFPAEPWIPYYLASLRWSDGEAAERLMASASSGFAARGEVRAEVQARAAHLRLLSRLGRIGEARADALRVADLVPRLSKPEDQGLALMTQARYLIAGIQNYEEALKILRLARERIFPDGPISFRKSCLLDLGDTQLALGHFNAARESFRRLQRLARSEAGGAGAWAEAQGLYGELRVLHEASIDEPRPEARDQTRQLAAATLAAARRAGNRDVEAKTLNILGLILDEPAARAALERCLAIATSDADRSFCWSALARAVGTDDPQRAKAALDNALTSARRADSLRALTYALREQVGLGWRLDSPEEAWSAARADMATLEALRDLQPQSMSRAQFFSMISTHFYWISGQLFQDALATGSSTSLDRAFEVGEHLRARSLIDALEHAGTAPPLSAEGRALGTERERTLWEIADLQRGLVAGAAGSAEHRRLLASWPRLEAREREIEKRIARTDPSFAGLRRDFATLASIRSALAPDEALLSYLIGPSKDMRGDFAGGAWLVVVTRSGARAISLDEVEAERAALRARAKLLAGLVARRDGREGPVAVSLYRTLLAPALDGNGVLDPAIRKLILVPDDALHLLPFGVLRAGEEGPPLATRFALETVPSATLWLRWRQERPVLGRQPALVLADPTLPGSGGRAAASDRAASFASDFGLGPLPFARREGRVAAERLGAGSELYVGAGASEARLKARLARPFGLLHLAAHAVVDEAAPERSGILLTPGGPAADGILQVREIVGLPLAGKVVVLSACRSGGGSVLRGEGVMGLARAFFQAGAHTVVASLWPLRDEAGAALFAAFYARLGEGLSVAEALRRAQGERVAAGAPAFDWAGVVVLGDGDLVPVPGGSPSDRRGRIDWRWSAIGAVLVAVAALAWSLVRRGRRHQVS